MEKKIPSCADIYKEISKQKAATDFWGQVARTVNGQPVSQAQIDMIIEAINEKLQFKPDDRVLDLGCGNGALSQYFFSKCNSWIGVDYSEYLVQVAKDNFELKPNFTFYLSDAVKFVENPPTQIDYTKALCYGTFAYFSDAQAEILLSSMRKQFPQIESFFIGNLPDRDRADVFYAERGEYSNLLDEANSPIGVWRSRDRFRELAEESGWKADFSQMPVDFFSSHYRYDVLLTPATEKEFI